MIKNPPQRVEMKTTPMSIKKSCLLFFLLAFSVMQAKIIDFDAVYGKEGNVAKNILDAIEKAEAYDIILFKSEYYMLDGTTNIFISKPITIQGAETGIGELALNKIQGASGIKTTLGHTADFSIKSNDVVFKNISLVRKDQTNSKDVVKQYDILIDARHNDYGTTSKLTYKGLVFNNVVLSQAGYLFHAGNGVEVKMTNVSFLDFRRIGYWVDRRGRVNNTGKADFINCLFKLRPETDGFKHSFDFRAISFDAGNTEYPIVLDLDKSTVKHSRFEHTGIALSRCHNMVIDDSDFLDREGLVDQVHIEEFSHNVSILGNTFDCGGPNEFMRTKIIVIDRELQLSKDILIDNNTIKNDYNFFISSYSVEDITITNNDFTEANARNENSINLGFYETFASEPIPDSSRFPSKNVVIKGNVGLDLAKNKGLSLLYLNDESKDNFDITDYVGRRTFKQISEPKPLVKNGTYHIVNKSTGQKLAVSGNTVNLASGTEEATQWNITWNSPYTYFIENISTSKFLETDAGYTENDLLRQGSNGTKSDGDISPYATNAYSTTSEKPLWAFVQVGDDFELFAGGNEKQSVIATNGSAVNLVYAKVFNSDGTRSPKVLGDNAKWAFVAVSGETTPTPTPPTADGTNLALNKKALQSSTYNSLGAQRVNDGNKTSFNHTLEDAEAWWQVDLGTVSDITNIEIYNRLDCCSKKLSDFHVFVSDVPFSATNLSDTKSQPGIGDYFTAGQAENITTLNVNRTGRYVRVQLSGTNSLHMGEVVVNGTEGEENAPPGSGISETITVEAESFNATGGTFDDSFAAGPGFGAEINSTRIEYVNSGDWVEYIVDVPKAGDYEVTYFISTPNNGATIDFSSDGIVSSRTNVPNTDGWKNFQELKASNVVTFTAGVHLIRLSAGGQDWAWNLDKFTLTGTNFLDMEEVVVNETEEEASPGSGHSETITVEAESFNTTGGTFNDTFAAGPGLGVKNNNSRIEYVNSGDWVEYLVTIPEAGAYEVTYFLSTPNNGATIDFSSDGIVSSRTNVPATGGWENYQGLNASNVATFATAGVHLIRLTAGGQDWAWNLDKFTLNKISRTNLKISLGAISEKTKLNIFPNPVSQLLYLENVEDYHTVNVYNLIGIKVMTKKLTTNYIDLSTIVNGIFMLEFVGDKKREMKKIVVKH